MLTSIKHVIKSRARVLHFYIRHIDVHDWIIEDEFSITEKKANPIYSHLSILSSHKSFVINHMMYAYANADIAVIEFVWVERQHSNDSIHLWYKIKFSIEWRVFFLSMILRIFDIFLTQELNFLLLLIMSENIQDEAEKSVKFVSKLYKWKCEG